MRLGLVLHFFRGFKSKTSQKFFSFKPNSIIYRRKSVWQMGPRYYQPNSIRNRAFVEGSKRRLYYVDRNKVFHFKRRGWTHRTTVGHAVARHTAEELFGISRVLRVLMLRNFLSGLVFDVSDHFLKRLRSRRGEIEADHIGLLIMASAGYDPRVAPEFQRRMDPRALSTFEEYNCTHPPGYKRAQILSHPKIMGEALSRYRKEEPPAPSMPVDEECGGGGENKDHRSGNPERLC